MTARARWLLPHASHRRWCIHSVRTMRGHYDPESSPHYYLLFSFNRSNEISTSHLVNGVRRKACRRRNSRISRVNSLLRQRQHAPTHAREGAARENVSVFDREPVSSINCTLSTVARPSSCAWDSCCVKAPSITFERTHAKAKEGQDSRSPPEEE